MKKNNKKLELALAKKLVHIVMQVLDLQYKNNDMSQQELAKKMGVSESYLSRVLGNSKYNLTLKTLVKMEQALGEPILITPNDYDAFLMKNADYLSALVRGALFENNIDEGTKTKLYNEILDITTHRIQFKKNSGEEKYEAPPVGVSIDDFPYLIDKILV